MKKTLRDSLYLSLCCVSGLQALCFFPDMRVVSPSALAHHARMLGELKVYIATKLVKSLSVGWKPSLTTTKKAPHPNNRAQTDAFLSLPDVKETVENYFGEYIKKHDIFVRSILEKERELSDAYYIFYHGQQGIFRVIHDIARALFEALGLRDLSDFIYLRFPEPFFDKKQSLEEFLDESDKLYGKTWHDDGTPELKRRILSVNLALYGNVGDGGECTFSYFINSRSIGAPSKRALLEEFFEQYDFNKKYIPHVLELYKMIETEEGNLLQIAVPKDKVDQCVYLSHAYATPYRNVIIPECFDTVKERHTSIIPVLEMWKNDPASIPNIRWLQARLVCFNDTFLNPDFGIKIFSYGTIIEQPWKVNLYNLKLKKLSAAIITEWIGNYGHAARGSHPLERLRKYIYKR